MTVGKQMTMLQNTSKSVSLLYNKRDIIASCCVLDQESVLCDRCSYGEIFCDEGSLCLSYGQICDGVYNCDDGFDEQNCPKTNQV